jgi:hypothetical protein
VDSNTISFTADTVPYVMDPITLSVVGVQVRIEWTLPNDGFSPIDYYHIQIYNVITGVMEDELANCDG